MKQLASFASLGELKNDGVFLSLGRILFQEQWLSSCQVDATKCQILRLDWTRSSSLLKVDDVAKILRLKYTKSFVGWGSAPDPTGGAYSTPPDP